MRPLKKKKKTKALRGPPPRLALFMYAFFVPSSKSMRTLGNALLLSFSSPERDQLQKPQTPAGEKILLSESLSILQQGVLNVFLYQYADTRAIFRSKSDAESPIMRVAKGH